MNRSRLVAPPSTLAAASAMKKQQERDRQPIVESCFDIQGLPDTPRHARAAHNHLPKPCVGRSENRPENACLPNRHIGGYTRCATSVPGRIVSSVPALSRPPGSVPMLRNTRRSVRLASVNSNSTRPSSATRRNTAALSPARAICTQAGYIYHAGGGEHDGRGDRSPSGSLRQWSSTTCRRYTLPQI